MGSLAIGLKQIYGGVKTIFGRSGNKAAKALTELKPAQSTSLYRDPITGIETMQREFLTKTKHGDDIYKLVKVESEILDNGAKSTRTHVWTKWPGQEYHFGPGGDTIDRTKTVAKKSDGILGGKQINIEKDYRETMAMSGYKETLVKEYNAKGQLDHKDLHYKNNNGYEIKATQDMVYDEIPLSSSFSTMYEEPVTHLNYKHTLSRKRGEEQYFGIEHSNHGNFKDKGTNYSRAVEAKDNAIKAEVLAKEETAKAAEKAAKELAHKRPRINVGKVLNGINVEELKVVEKVQPNGGVKRYYFLPETGAGKRKPVITTYDHGSLHKEWIHNGKEDAIFLKQVGNDEPYIYMQKGNYKQIHSKNKEGKIVDEQYFTDGKNKYYRKGPESNYYYEGEMNNPHYGNRLYDYSENPLIKFNSHHTNTFGECTPPVQSKEPMYSIDSGYVTRANQQKMQLVKTAAENEYIDLTDLLKPFKT